MMTSGDSSIVGDVEQDVDYPSLKLSASSPLQNQWLENDPFLLGWQICRCYMLVSGRVHDFF